MYNRIIENPDVSDYIITNIAASYVAKQLGKHTGNMVHNKAFVLLAEEADRGLKLLFPDLD